MESGNKNKVLEFAEQHPYILLIVISILVIIILIMFLNSCGYITRRKKCRARDSDDDFDEIIESIHNKQKPKK